MKFLLAPHWGKLFCVGWRTCVPGSMSSCFRNGRISGLGAFCLFAILSFISMYPSVAFAESLDRIAADAADAPRNCAGRYIKPSIAGRELRLVFDDGPHPVITPRILSILREHCVKASFFVIGRNAKRHPNLVQEIHRSGHLVGTHTRNHFLPLEWLPIWLAEWEISSAVKIVADIIGTKPLYFRFPRNRTTLNLNNLVNRLGLIVVNSDISTRDWTNADPSISFEIFKRGLQLRENGNVIFHDTQSNTPKLLEMIIEYAFRQNYQFR